MQLNLAKLNKIEKNKKKVQNFNWIEFTYGMLSDNHFDWSWNLNAIHQPIIYIQI